MKQLGLDAIRLLLGRHPINYTSSVTVLPFGAGKIVLVNDAQYVDHILFSHSANYPRGPLHNKSLEPLLGRSILCTDDGEQRKIIRRIATEELATGVESSLLPIVEAHFKALFDHDLERILAYRDIRRMTASIMAHYLFAEDAHNIFNRLFTAVEGALELVGRPLPYILRGMPSWLRPACYDEVTQHIDSARDALRTHVKACRTSIAQAQHFCATFCARLPHASDDEIVHELFGLFAAGFETTASAVFHTLACLADNHAVQARLRNEIEDAALIQNAPGLSRILKEALRLFPPAYMMHRVARRDDIVGGCLRIRKGTHIMISPLLLHRNPRYWSQPGTFNPDRFLLEEQTGRARGVYIPFGGGPYGCIGPRLAMAESSSICGLIVRHYEVRKHLEWQTPPRLSATLQPQPEHLLHLRAGRRALPNSSLSSGTVQGV